MRLRALPKPFSWDKAQNHAIAAQERHFGIIAAVADAGK
jgi:hypothetical protein